MDGEDEGRIVDIDGDNIDATTQGAVGPTEGRNQARKTARGQTAGSRRRRDEASDPRACADAVHEAITKFMNVSTMILTVKLPWTCGSQDWLPVAALPLMCYDPRKR